MFKFSKFKLLAFIVLSVTFVFGSIGGCSSSTSGSRVRITGFVLSVDGDPNDVAGISVAVINPGNGERRTRIQTTGLDGEFSLNVNVKGRQEVLTLVFTTLGAEVFSDDFILSKGGEVVLSVSLAGSGDVNIAPGDYSVAQARINLDGDRSYIFVDALGLDTPGKADLTILGGGNTCIRLRNDASVLIGVRNFIMDACDFGMRASNNATIIISASNDFEVQSATAGVEASNNAIVSLSAQDNFIIQALDTFGIIGRGASVTTVNEGQPGPGDICIIEGPEGSVLTNDTAVVDVPLDCLL